MKTLQWSHILAVCLVAVPLAFGQTPADNTKIDALIKKLGSAAFAQRETARKELEALGTPALEALRRADTTADVETKRRLAGIIAQLEERLVRELVLAPKMVHLKLDGASVKAGIDELARVSGYPIQFRGDATKIADKKITLDTGRVTYWQALDQFCELAGLVEKIDLEAGDDQPLFKRVRARSFVSPAKAAAVGPLLLTPGPSKKSLLHVVGPLKTEVRIARDASTRELVLTFIVSAEPRLVDCGVVGTAMLSQISDQDGRKLAVVPERPKTEEQINRQLFDSTPYPPLLPGRHAQIRIKEDDAKRLKEVIGKFTLVVDVPNQELARMPNIMAAAGKSVKAFDATARGKLTVHNVRTLPNSDSVEMSLSLENLTPDPYHNAVVIKNNRVIIRSRYNAAGTILGANGVTIHGNGAGVSKDLPDLMDAKGKKFKLVVARGDQTTNTVNGSRRNAQIVFAPEPGQAEPSDLVLFGIRTYALAVPFRFENVPLPDPK